MKAVNKIQTRPFPGNGYDIVLSPANRVALHALIRQDFASERAYWLRLQTERLSLIQGFEELLATEVVSVAPFPYQLKTAREHGITEVP